jgi:bifunctional enzyme CysN/CysC
MGLNNNLGFSEEDRIENIRRIAEVCRLMNDAGLIVLAAFISPFARDRRHAREIIGDSFVEVYVSTPLEECVRRDVKGLYAKAQAGEIPDFTGISSPYEIPEFPEATIDTTTRSIDENASLLLKKLKGYLL